MTALSPSVQAILDLFEGPLREVRFADIDAPTLARLAAEVEASAAELAAQEATLDSLRRALAERQEQLLGVAQRALAYARVYAETDEVLSAQLAAIQLPRPARRAKEKPLKAESPTANGEAASPAPVQEVEEGASAAAQTEEANESASPAQTTVSRRGKRRERVVSLDDGSA